MTKTEIEKNTLLPEISEIGDVQNLSIFNKDALKVIAATPLFNDKEKKELALASASMEKAFFNSQVFRTFTEVVISVLNDVRFPTIASKYYQALREMKVHSTELVFLLYEYETTKEDLKILEADVLDLKEQLENATKESDKIRLTSSIKKKQIEMAKIAFTLKEMKKTADGRKKEIMQWNQLMNEFEPLLIKEGIPLDDPNAHQLISYTIRFIKQMVSALLTKSEFEPGEAANLIGQLSTSLKYVQMNNLMDKVLPYLDKVEIEFLQQQNLLIDETIENKEKQPKLDKK